MPPNADRGVPTGAPRSVFRGSVTRAIRTKAPSVLLRSFHGLGATLDVAYANTQRNDVTAEFIERSASMSLALTSGAAVLTARGRRYR